MSRRSRDAWSCRTVARHAGQLRRCGRSSSSASLVAVPDASATSVGASRSHSTPASSSAYSFMKRRRPSVMQRFTFVYVQPSRSPISTYDSPSALSISARASSRFRRRMTSADRSTRSADSRRSSTDRTPTAGTASRSTSSPATPARPRRTAKASCLTTTFSHASSVAGSRDSTRRM